MDIISENPFIECTYQARAVKYYLSLSFSITSGSVRGMQEDATASRTPYGLILPISPFILTVRVCEREARACSRISLSRPTVRMNERDKYSNPPVNTEIVGG